MINFRKGFTLLELLVVVAIIGLLTSIVVISLTNARNKGIDAGVQSNLRNAISQAEIFYGINTAAPNSYTSVCTNGTVGGAPGIGAHVFAAAKAARLSNYATNPALGGTLTTATCNYGTNAWAAEAPLSTSGKMWCVDSAGKSKEESSSIGTGTACN